MVISISSSSPYRQAAKRLLLASVPAAALFAAPAHAQDQTAPAATEQAQDGEAAVETVIVTARRRGENLDRVPASVTAFGTEELAARSINTEADLQRSVAGLTIRESLSSNQLNYSLRGQSVDAYTSSSPGVLPYINEFQVTSTSASSFIDLQSVQVLKGPQGTLFGRNTTGGAVLYTTGQPTNELSGRFAARLGNYDLRALDGMLNIPVVDDRVLLRVAGNILRRDGFQYNDITGDDLGRDSSQTGRVTLLLRPTDGLDINTMFQHSTSNGTNTGSLLYNAYPATPSTPTFAAGLYAPTGPLTPAGWAAYIAARGLSAYPGGLLDFAAIQDARGPYRVSLNGDQSHRSRSTILTNTITWEASDNITLKNIFGYSNSRSADTTDVDGSPYTIYTYNLLELDIEQVSASRQWSNEFQIQGNAGAFQYIAGGYLGYERRYSYIPTAFFDLRPVVPIGAGNFADKEAVQTSRNQGVFFHGSYDFSSLGAEGLKLTAGLRYTWEQVRARHLSRSIYAALGFAPNGVRTSFDRPSWNIGLEYQATSSLLVYITNRGSWRSGGFNTGSQLADGNIAVGGAEFAPERTTDIEAGLKFNGYLGSTPARFNIAVFNQWVDDIQRAVYVNILTPIPLGPTALTANVPQATITGVELEAEVRPAPWLTIGGTLSYLDARFNKNNVTIFGVPYAFGPYPDTPEWAGSVFVQAAGRLPDNLGRYSIRGDVYAQSKFYYSSVANTLTPGAVLPGYTLVNLRADWHDIGGSGFGAALFVTNLFNETYYTGGLALGSVLGLNTAIPGRPRMFGGEVSFRF
jgi:iron complex outermembrane receptor protein